MELHSKIYADGMVPVHGYNARSEVVSALMGTNIYGYAYDPIGNRVEASRNAITNLYSANSLNQYSTITSLCASVPLCELTYDADGNTISDDRFTYYWNGGNRMVCASNDEVIVTYAYDHRGRMVRKNISRGDTEPQRIGYVWDNWNIIRETATDLSTFQPFNFSTSYVWGLDLDGTLQGAGGVGGLLAVLRDDGAFLPTYDANGNITEYLATNGTVAAHYEYSAFGEPIVSDGELAASFTHQFSTKPYCAITGFNEYVYRKYMAEIGRWMSRDPICEINFYWPNKSSYTPVKHIRATHEANNDITISEYAAPRTITCQFDFIGLKPCQCCFKGSTGKLRIDNSCRKKLKIWIIDEHGDPASGGISGRWVDVDGFVIDGNTYKVDGSSCINISCSGDSVAIDACVNYAASIIGKKPPYIVPPGEFGGPPKEPEEGADPPYVQ